MRNESESANVELQSSGRVPIMEVFGPTIQGEGALIGMPTYFIRVGGCSYRCTMCDSMHAVDPDLVKQDAVWHKCADIYPAYRKRMDVKKARWVTLSGGNPVMWNLHELVQDLHKAGFKVAVETQGDIWQSWLTKVDHVTISPKTPGMGEKWELNKVTAMVRELKRESLGSHCIKIPVFMTADKEDPEGFRTFRCDLEHVVEAKQKILDTPIYISLGNPWFASKDGNVPNLLLDRFNELVIEVQNFPELNDVPILPQLHVLLWGNALGV